MLAQDTKALRAAEYEEEIGLYSKEITFFRSEMSTMSTINSFFAGFIYSRMYDKIDWSGDLNDGKTSITKYMMEVVLRSLTIFTFLLNMMGILSALILQIFASMAVLKASVAELTRLMYKIRKKRRMVIRIFLSAILMAVITSMFSMFAFVFFKENNVVESFFAIGLYVLFGLYLIRVMRGMDKAFQMPPLLPAGCRRLCCDVNEERLRKEREDYQEYRLDASKRVGDTGDYSGGNMQLEFETEQSAAFSTLKIDCHKCQTPCNITSKFCEKCGTLQLYRCQHCKVDLLGKKHSKFCYECGQPLTKEQLQLLANAKQEQHF